MTDLHDLLTNAYEALKDAHPYIENDTVRNTVGRVIVDIEEAFSECSELPPQP